LTPLDVKKVVNACVFPTVLYLIIVYLG